MNVYATRDFIASSSAAGASTYLTPPIHKTCDHSIVRFPNLLLIGMTDHPLALSSKLKSPLLANANVDVKPKVSIGMPVYNGVQFLSETLISMLNQSFSDFEIIISDNASTDGTEKLCREAAGCDSRVRYYRQPENLGGPDNFKFVLDNAQGVYFMWVAVDDPRSIDFLAHNVAWLDEHPGYVASTSPNCYEGEEGLVGRYVRFSLEGNLEERYLGFLRNSWRSHGIFYSLMRTSVISECAILRQGFTAVDWAIDFFLVSRGPVKRTEFGLMIVGLSGLSSSAGAWNAYRSNSLEHILPLYRFSLYALGLMKPLSLKGWLNVFIALLRLNAAAFADQAYYLLYLFYCRYLKLISRSRAS